ncbi:MAG: hypothetical protein AAGA66_08320 [Bacteroidota bacterium]
MNRFSIKKPDSVHQLLHIDQQVLNPGINTFQFGYSLKKDSLEACYKMYSAFAEYDPKNSGVIR